MAGKSVGGPNRAVCLSPSCSPKFRECTTALRLEPLDASRDGAAWLEWRATSSGDALSSCTVRTWTDPAAAGTLLSRRPETTR
jgi:hypothetical protein